jgi:hypothetical protein
MVLTCSGLRSGASKTGFNSGVIDGGMNGTGRCLESVGLLAGR